jgi:hypothetical protein
MLAEHSPTVQYYRAHEGRWRGVVRFEITDRAVFRAARLSWLDRLSLLAFASLPRWTGELTMETSLEAGDCLRTGEVIHHTALRKLGVTLYRSREVFRLAPDGRAMSLSRVQRPWPGFPQPEDFGEGSVTEDAQGATYDWLWYDRRTLQTTRRVEGGLDVQLRSDWSFMHTVLVRQGAPQG